MKMAKNDISNNQKGTISMIWVNKRVSSVSHYCDGCGRTMESSGDSLYYVTVGNVDTVELCSDCALKLADKLYDVLGKTPVDIDSKSYKEGYCNGYREGFTDRRELND